MNPTRFWIAAAIIALAVLSWFILSAPRAGGDPPREALSVQSPSTPPEVTLRDSYKKGVHTITGSLDAPTACTEANATAELEDAAEGQRILLRISMPEDTDICLRVPTRVLFEASVSAPAELPIAVTVNGQAASRAAP